ncbi:MAG TPA: hypothetical protein VHG08_13710 [Longimicrobium sp.]|nr:hypothetical protein [Longimicrobium sp.]
MQHLDLEQLARLVDEPAEPHEAEHLRGCLVCRRELAEMRAQTEALGSLADPEPPAHAWAELEGRLLAEKLIGRPAPFRPLGIHRPPMRIAAAIALFLLGGAAGAVLMRTPGAQHIATLEPTTVRAPRATGVAGPPEVMYFTGPGTTEAAEPDGNGARLAVNGAAEPELDPPAVTPRRPAPQRATAAEADQAARELVQAQATYMAALQRLVAIADPGSGNAPETRMAALERLVQLTVAALERVPGDPVINGYHLAAVAERDALRREMEKDAQTNWF